MNEPNKAVQEEELEALRAIFEDDWNDIPPKKTAWGQQESGWWEVTLRAEDDARVSVKMRGRMTKAYPDQAPPLQLAEPSNLSPTHMSTLSRLLEAKAKASVGAPMIFDLADFVREWIATNHMPLTRPGEVVPTLMEEMAQREEAQRAVEAAQLQADQEQRRAAAEEQNRLLQEKIQLDASRKEERARQAVQEAEERRRQDSLASLADGELEVRDLLLDNPIRVDGYDGAISALSLFGGRKEALWTSYIAEPLVDGGPNPGFVKASLLTLGVVVVDFSHKYYSTLHGRKRVDALTVEVGRLEMVDSDNVQKVYAVKREKSPKGFERLVIVVERAPEGGKLRGWLPKQGLGEETAREYITHVLCGLADMHRRNVTQKQIDPDLVLLIPSASGNLGVKLTGTCYARRIIEYHRSNPFLKSLEDVCPESWLSPDEIDAPYSYASKRDIWHAGLLLLQMLYGTQCIWTYPDLHTLLQHAPGGVSESMMEILSGLLNPSSKKRFTAEEALSKLRAEDEITRRPSKQSTLSQHSSITLGQTSPMDIFGRSPVFGRGLAAYFPQTLQANAARTSRYRTDFEEVEFLGKGGFGEVVKARNRLDGRSYAIKKVKLRPEDNEQKVFREVNSLSRVSHQYIVRYYGCWLEEVGPPERSDSVDSAPATSASESIPTPAVDDDDIFAVNLDELNMSRREQSRSASFPRIRFANSENSDDDDEDDDSDETDSTDGTDTDSDSGTDSDAETAADPSEQANRGRARPLAIPIKHSRSVTDTTTDDGMVQRILYIQMEFVEKQTLREAIAIGLEEDEAWRLLVQILQALAHMSSLGIVHRGQLGKPCHVDVPRRC
ncbi:eukaryotic translation initiation factor 2-alpha kinase [Cryptotrichosporon argae]